MYGHAPELQDAYYTQPLDARPGMPARTVYTAVPEAKRLNLADVDGHTLDVDGQSAR
jgi:hypothetical protein